MPTNTGTLTDMVQMNEHRHVSNPVVTKQQNAYPYAPAHFKSACREGGGTGTGM